MICRILDTIVITEIYRSPPVTESTLLQQIVTRLLVSCMIKPAVPRLIIFFARLPQSRISSPDRRRTFNSVFFRRKYRTNAAERICDNTVAIAAPRIPSPNTKIKTGSRIRKRCWKKCQEKVFWNTTGRIRSTKNSMCYRCMYRDVQNFST